MTNGAALDSMRMVVTFATFAHFLHDIKNFVQLLENPFQQKNRVIVMMNLLLMMMKLMKKITKNKKLHLKVQLNVPMLYAEVTHTVMLVFSHTFLLYYYTSSNVP